MPPLFCLVPFGVGPNNSLGHMLCVEQHPVFKFSAHVTTSGARKVSDTV